MENNIISTDSSFDNGDLITTNAGGLNVESSPLAMPAGDSPDMLNIQIRPAGTLYKRPGTIIRGDVVESTSGSPFGNGWVSVQIPNGHTLLVGKFGRDLVCYAVGKHAKMGRSNLMYPYVKIPNIWTADTNSIRPSICVTPDSIPRVIIATGLNTMVECFVYSKTITVSTPSTSVSVTDKPFTETPDVTLIDGGTSASTVMFIPNYIKDEDDWVVYRANSKSTVGNVVTFSGGFRELNSTGAYAALPAGEYTVARLGWLMWTESIMLGSDRLTQPVVLVSGTFSVKIPTELVANSEEERRLDATNPFACFSCSILNSDAPSWLVPKESLTDNTHFITSDVGAYKAVTNDRWQIGSTYIIPKNSTIGAFYVHRHYRNWLANDSGLRHTDMRCAYGLYTGDEVNLNLLTSYTNFTSAPYQPILTDWSTTKNYSACTDTVFFNPVTSVLSPIKYFSFQGSYPMGLPSGYGSLSNFTSFVAQGFIGTEIPPNDDNKVKFKDGSKVPIGGLYEFSFGAEKDFGRIVASFQNRVVVSGFSRYPSLVVFSNTGYEYDWDVGDNLLAGNRNFQTWYSDPELAYNPLQIQIDTQSGEVITALLPIENNLLVFTNRSVSVVSASSQSGYISPTDYSVSKIVDIGTFNQDTVLVTESGVIFLSRSGLNILVPSEYSSSRFKSVPLSDKVKRIFDEMSTEVNSNHWITVDQNQTVYIGLCTQGRFVATRLLIYDLRLNAWSEYGAANGHWFSTHGLCLSDGRLFTDYISSTNLLLGTPSTDYHLLVEFSKFAKLDFIISKTGSSLYTSTAPIPVCRGVLPFSPVQNFYQFNLKSVNSTNVLRGIGVPDVLDRSSLNPEVVYPLDPRTGLYPIYFNIDNVWVDITSYVLSGTTIFVGGVTNVNPASKVLIGLGFPVWYKSSMFTRAVMNGARQDDLSKRYTHCILHFRNSDTSKFTISDLNTEANQAPFTIVDRYRTVYEANLSVLFNSSTSAYTTYMVYTEPLREVSGEQNIRITSGGDVRVTREGNTRVTVPVSVARVQSEPISRIILPLLGTSNSAQVCVFSYGYHEFELAGYQLLARQTGKRRKSWQDLY